MNRPYVNKQGEVDPKSVDQLSRDDLEHWIRARLQRKDLIVPGGAHGNEMPHYLLALLYPQLERQTQKEFQDIVIGVLKDLANDPESDWSGEPGHECIMLADPVLIQSPRREEAVDLLLDIVNALWSKLGPWPNLHFRALQGLIALRHRNTIDFWREQIQVGDLRYSPVVLEGLALIDVAAPFNLLKEIRWDDAVDDGITGLLPSLLEDYGTAKVAGAIEDVLPELPSRGYNSLLSFCEQEGITLSLRDKSPKKEVASKLMQRDDIPYSLESRIAALSSVKQTLLHKRLKEQGSIQKATKIPRHLRTDNFPLSYVQRRLWFLCQLEPDSPIYNLFKAVVFTGELDIACLERSLNELVWRHESLRTSFGVVDGSPVQIVSPPMPLKLDKVKLNALPKEDRNRQVLELTILESQRSFDLSAQPLVRLKLLQVDQEENVLLLTMHSIISDDWSINVFLGELITLYNAFSKGQPSPLPELPIQYADFAAWQIEWFQEKALESQLNYWRERLGSPLPVLELPSDRARPPTQSFRGARFFTNLSNSLIEPLRELSLHEGVTLFMTLLATYQVLLHRYTTNEDITIGTPIAGRNRAETESLIGPFVNNLILRTDLSGNPRFVDLLQRVREVALSAYAHQDVPFEMLLEVLRPERSLSYTPLFQVMFQYQNAPPQLNLSNLGLSLLEVDRQISRLDMTMVVTEKSVGGCDLTVEYNTDLFDESTIARMANHFKKLLQSVIENPKQHLSDLSLLTEAERRQILFEWNNTYAQYPETACIHELFEAQVRLTPDRRAVSSKGKQLTYYELNTSANRFARRLRALGVGPEVPVGICVDRSVEMIVALLGILKAGGTYVPLDPVYPQERLYFMIEEANIKLVVTQEWLVDFLPTGAHLIFIDQDTEDMSIESAENVDSGVLGDNLAYIIYTSGSTGAPKGIQVTHRSVTNLLIAMRQQLGVKEQDVVQAMSPLSFDIAALEMYLSFLVGAQLVIASHEVIVNETQLIQDMEEYGVTVIQSTPSNWYRLLAAGWQGKADLKILSGGELLTQDLVDQLMTRGDSLWNMYGPTETTIWSITQKIETTEMTVSIGRPIANTEAYVLNESLEPVPVGVIGELYIGGDGLARGYLNRPELTASAFIPNPYSQEPGRRLYRTGDLARYLDGGILQFLGRSDQQIKIRGYHVELGEIDAVLLAHPVIREAVVIARDYELGARKLVAYIACAQREEISIGELREYMRERLPEYMVPEQFIFLDHIPLTANGKVDRRALSLYADVEQVENAYTPPGTPSEEVVAAIWAEVLGVERVGRYDNFFELGADSVLVIRVTSRLRKTFGIEISPRTVFEYQTVISLTKNIETLMQQLLQELEELSEYEATQQLVTRKAPLGLTEKSVFSPERDLIM